MRIDEPEDFVRLEIESALSSAQVRTMPVLVENAQMPGADELPASIARLARINAIELSDMRWRADLDRLVDAVEALGFEKGKIAPYAPAPAPAAPAARTSLSIGAVGNVGHDPGEARPFEEHVPSGQPRTPVIAYLLMVVPVVSLGFLAWVPALWAALKRRPGDPNRARLLMVAAALAVVQIVGLTLPSAAGGGLFILAMAAGTTVAIVFRKPPLG